MEFIQKKEALQGTIWGASNNNSKRYDCCSRIYIYGKNVEYFWYGLILCVVYNRGRLYVLYLLYTSQ